MANEEEYDNVYAEFIDVKLKFIRIMIGVILLVLILQMKKFKISLEKNILFN